MSLHRNIEALEQVLEQELEQSSNVKHLLNTFNVKTAEKELMSCFTSMLYDWSHIDMQPLTNNDGNKTNGILIGIFAG